MKHFCIIILIYGIFKSRITAGGYQLADIQRRMKKLYSMGDLTEEQLDELMALSQKNAAADAERPEVIQLLQEVAKRVEALEQKLGDPENPEGDNGKEPAAYEAWTAWDGISNKYQPGAIVTHNGKLWKSVFAGQNVWTPGDVGTEALWVEYTPEEA